MVSAASSGVLASHDSAALVGVTEDDTAAVISSEHDHQLSSPKTAAASFWSSGSGAGGSVGGGGGGHIGMVGGCKYSAAGLSSFDYHQGKWGGGQVPFLCVQCCCSTPSGCVFIFVPFVFLLSLFVLFCFVSFLNVVNSLRLFLLSF